MNDSLSKQKIIWITGASSGIGEAMAYLYAKENHKLILSGRNVAALQEVINKCQGGEVFLHPFDLTDVNFAKERVIKALSFFGKIDILINNGGISQRSLIAETPVEVDRKIMEVDYFGQIALTKALLPHFIDQKEGQFVVVSSVMGKYASPYRSGYCAAKHALHGFFDALRMEQEKNGISVTMICPGFVQTQVSVRAITADGTPQDKDDHATKYGMPVEVLAQKMHRAIHKKRFEVYIGGKEAIAVYIKRWFPLWLHKIVLKNKVR